MLTSSVSLGCLHKVLINGVGLLGGLTQRLLGCIFLALVPASWLVHGDFVLRVHVHTQTHGVLVEVVHRVEVLQESVTDQEEVLVLAGQSALVDHEVAFLMARLIEVLFRIDLENVVTHLETNWLHLWCNIFTALLNVAEGLVRCAVQVWQSLGPFLSNLLEDIWRNRELGGSSIDIARDRKVER